MLGQDMQLQGLAQAAALAAPAGSAGADAAASAEAAASADASADEPAAAASADVPAAAPAAPVLTESVDTQHDHVHQARKLGYVVGAHATDTTSDSGDVFQIRKIENGIVTLVQRHDGDDGTTSKTDVETMLKSWKLFKGKVTADLTGWDPSKCRCSPVGSSKWAFSALQGLIAFAIRAKAMEHEAAYESIRILQNPTCVKTTRAVAKGSLVLVPCTERIDKVVQGKTSKGALELGSYTIDKFTFEVQALPQFVPPLNKDGEQNKTPWVCPFWLVGEPDGAVRGNMQMHFETVQVHDLEIKVPVLTNNKKLTVNEHLLWNKSDAPSAKKRKV